MDSKSINSINRILNRDSSNTSISNTSTTRWDEVFGQAQTKVSQGKTKQANSSNNISTYSGSSNSGITSLNLGINPKVVDYSRYQAFNDLEKQFQSQGLYKADEITNPYHHTKTNNHFKIDIKKEFEGVYGAWDGESKDGNGFAYIDKYGFSHVSDNFFDSLIYSKDGKVYNYEGKTMGGDAVDANGNRMWLSGLDGSKPFGNAQPLTEKDKELMEQTTPNVFNTDSVIKKPNYSDSQVYISSSRDTVNTTKYKLFELPVYYGLNKSSDTILKSDTYDTNEEDYSW